MIILRAAHAAHAGHFAVAGFEDALVFGVGCGGFLAVAAREAGVDFVVEGAADGFADALGEGVSKCQRLRVLGDELQLTCKPCAAAFRFANVLLGAGWAGWGMGSSRMSVLLG